MHPKFHVLIPALIAFAAQGAAAVEPAAKPPQRPVPGIILARPVDVSTVKDSKSRWFSALSEAVVHFKLDALQGIRVAPLPLVMRHLPAYRSFDKEIDDREYLKLAREVRASHLVMQKYELAEGGKVIQYYAEVISAYENKSIGAVERSFQIEATGEALDSCIKGIVKILGLAIPNDMARFFGFSVLSNDPKSLKDLGEAIILFSYSAEEKASQSAQSLEAIINRDAHIELAYYLCGKAYMAGGRHKKAAEMFRSFFDVLPEYGPLYLDYLRSLRLAKDYNEALRIAAIGEGKLPGYLPLLVEKAAILDAAGQKASAERAFAGILELDPDYPEALLFIARSRNAQGKPQDALALLDRVITKNPANCEALAEKGRALRTLQKEAEAIALLLQAAACNPQDPEPLLGLGELYLQAKEYAKAAERFEQAVALLPNEFSVHEKAARASRLAGNLRKAYEILKRVEGRFSTNTVLQKELGLLELELGDTAGARRHLESCFSEQKADPRVLMGLGDIYTGAALFDEAFKMYNTALPVIADKNACRIALARLYLLKAAPGQAEKYLGEVIGSDPKYRKVNRYYGDARFLSADKNTALTYYLRERELYGDELHVQQQICTIYFEAENWTQSEIELVRLLKLAPDDAKAQYRLAVAYLRLKNKEKAREWLVAAEKLGKPDQELLFQLGRGFVASGLFEKAVDAYRACLAAAPKRQKAWIELAEALLSLKREKEAADAYVQLFSLNNDAFNAQFAEAGHLYLRLGLKADAKRVYVQYLDKKYANPEVNAKLAQLEYEGSNHARVIALLEGIAGEWAAHEPTQMILAESYFATGAYAKAIAVVEAVVKAAPSHRRALELLALSYEKKGALVDACGYYERYLALPPDDKHRDYAFHLGELYERQMLREKAAERYRRNIETYSADIRNYDRLASMYFASERWRDCERTLGPAMKLADAPAKFRLMMARSLTGQNKNDDAVGWYQQYLTMAPADSSAWKELGAIFYAAGDFAKAITPLKMAVKYMHGNIECIAMLGMAYYETNQFSEAIEQLSAVHAARKNDVKVMSVLAQCYRTRKDTSALIPLLRQWTSVEAGNGALLVELGGYLVGRRALPEAVSVLTSATKIQDNNPVPYRLLAQAYEMQGDDKQWLRALQAVAERAPKDPEARFQIARYFLGKGQESKAEPYLKEAVEKGATHAAARYEYANLLLKAGKTDEAYRFYSEAVQLEPGRAIYQSQLAFTASMLEKMDQALAAAEAALANDSKSLRVLYVAATVYSKAGQTVKAKQLLRSALTLSDSCVECHEAMGDANLVEANYKLAVKSLMRAWELGGYREPVALKLAWALIMDEKYVEAADFAKMALAKNPACGRAAYLQSIVLCRQGKPGDAQKLIDNFQKKNEKSGWIHLAQGGIYETQGEIEAAWISFNVALRLLPNEPQVQAAAGRIYLARSQYQTAAEHFGRALAQDANNPYILVNLAEAFEGLNDIASATELCNTVIQRVPENPEPYYVLARMSSGRKDHRQALNYINQGLARNPSSAKLLYVQGHALRATSQPMQAIAAYEAALKNGTGFTEALRHIADIYYTELKEMGKAKEYYQKYFNAGGTNVDAKERLKGL